MRYKQKKKAFRKTKRRKKENERNRQGQYTQRYFYQYDEKISH